MDAAVLYKNATLGSITTINGGGSCLGVGGFFTFADDSAQLLLQQLPPVVHLRSETDKADLRSSLDRMRQEFCEQRPGSYLVTQQLATTMLVQALRLHMEEGFGHRVGWLFALADPQMRTAIHAIHSAPADPWTIASLAQRCGMSRSVFAQRFKSAVGVSPMEYLTRWRMLLARDRLTRSADSVSAIARSLGYDSESAFSKAFRRVLNTSPRELRRTRHTPAHEAAETASTLLPRYTGSNDSHPRMAS
jgi:AraC-like DNA-binding protein